MGRQILNQPLEGCHRIEVLRFKKKEQTSLDVTGML